MVRRLVLIEMTALFDMAKIDWKSNKVVKLKEKGEARGSGTTLFVRDRKTREGVGRTTY